MEARAEKNEEALKQMISMDEGAGMLGECAGALGEPHPGERRAVLQYAL